MDRTVHMFPIKKQSEHKESYAEYSIITKLSKTKRHAIHYKNINVNDNITIMKILTLMKENVLAAIVLKLKKEAEEKAFGSSFLSFLPLSFYGFISHFFPIKCLKKTRKIKYKRESLEV